MKWSPATRKRASLALRVLFGLAGVAFLAVAFLRTLDRAGSRVIPSPVHVLTAAGLIAVGLLLASRGWFSLLPNGSGRLLARGFFVAQLGKYIPGAVWQPVGQIGWAARAGVPLPVASVAFPVFALTQVVAAGCVGAFYVLGGSGASAYRLPALLGFAPLVLLHRGWMAWMLRALSQRITRLPEVDGLIPGQRPIIAAVSWNVLAMLAASSAFTVLWRGIGAQGGLITSSAAFALGWVVGFVAVPFPAGIGPREAAFLALLPEPAAVVISASLAYRLATMGAELFAAGVVSLPWLSPDARARRDPQPDEELPPTP